MTNNGFLIEEQMVYNINEKYYSELNDNLKSLVENLFGRLDDDDYFECELIHGFAKPDFVIKWNGIKRYVSMKSGNATIMHSGEISNFVSVLRRNDISEKTINTILKFYYGDLTVDGTGEEEYNHKEIMERMADEIREANIELNGDPVRRIKLANIFMFIGLNPDLPRADVIYHGDYKKGVMVTKSQINAHIKRKSFATLYTMHIGPLIIRPSHRRRKGIKPCKDVTRRIVLEWVFIRDDLEWISKKYTNYYTYTNR